MHPRLVATRLSTNSSPVRLIEQIWASGDSLLPLDPGLTELEVAELLARMRPHVLLRGFEEVAVDDPAPLSEGTALVIGTSGTTGLPKGVVLSHAALEAAARLTNLDVGAERGQRWLCCLPPAHIAGTMTLLRSRALGTEAVVHPRFDVEAIRSETEAEFLSVVPTMLHRLLEAEVDLRRFSRVLVGGAIVDDDLVNRARASGARVTVSYGMTETCGGVVYDGLPLPGVDITLDGEGRISISSPTLMSGYRLDPDTTKRALIDDRYVTQDRGAWDDDGRLRVLGRLDRMIITGGKNVSPNEVEEVLCSHPEILDAAVWGEPDETWGQRVVTEVVPRDVQRPPTSNELIEFLRVRISPFKIPRVISVAMEEGDDRSDA